MSFSMFNIFQVLAILSSVCAQSASYSYSGANADENVVIPGKTGVIKTT